MRYLLLIYTAEQDRVRPGTPDFDRVMAGHAALRQRLDERNAFLGAERLQSVGTARSVRVRNGQRLVSDGPFAETKEQLGGSYVIEATDKAEAMEYAAMVPLPPGGGAVEVRPVLQFG